MISDITKSVYFKLMFARRQQVIENIRQQNSHLNNYLVTQEQLPTIYKYFSDWAESYLIKLQNKQNASINNAVDHQTACLLEKEKFIKLYIDHDIKEQIFAELDLLLLQKDIDLHQINDQYLNQFGYAIIEQDIITIEWLLSKGQDINQIVRSTPFGVKDYALNVIIYDSIENLNMLNFFIKRGANIHQLPSQFLSMWGNKCFEYSLINGAVMYGKLESFKLLVENGAHFDPTEAYKLAKIFLSICQQGVNFVGNPKDIQLIIDYFEKIIPLEVLSGLNMIAYPLINNEIIKEKILLFTYGTFVTKLIKAAEVKFSNKHQANKDILVVKPQAM